MTLLNEEEHAFSITQKQLVCFIKTEYFEAIGTKQKE